MNRVIRVATEADIPALLVLAERFADETHLDLQFDREHATRYLETLVNHDDTAFFISDDVSAGIIVTATTDWFKRPFCFIENLYVTKEQRGSGVARVLINTAITFAKIQQCSHIFIGQHSGLSDKVNKQFMNLVTKSGFGECGSNFVKVI